MEALLSPFVEVGLIGGCLFVEEFCDGDDCGCDFDEWEHGCLLLVRVCGYGL